MITYYKRHVMFAGSKSCSVRHQLSKSASGYLIIILIVHFVLRVL